MAIPKIVKREDGTTWFTLSNKPEIVFRCDDIDYHIISESKSWFVHVATKPPPDPYIRRHTKGQNGKMEYFHRILLTNDRFSPSSVVDHIDTDTKNCTRENLRLVDQTENQKNRRRRPKNISHRGILMVKIKDGEFKERYQSFNRGKFIASCRTIDELKVKIDKYLDEKLKQE